MLITAVDIGGTSIKSGVVSFENGEFSLLSFKTTPTEAAGGKDKVIENIIRSIDLTGLGFPVSRIAVSTAGEVNHDNGSIIYATETLPGFTGLDLRGVIESAVNIKTTVINDAVASLIGEVFFNPKLIGDRILALTLGTGLGSAILNYRIPLEANSVTNLNIAHINLYDNGRLCACGKRGCAEQYVSATGLKKNFGGKMPNFKHSINKEALDKFISDMVKIMLIAENEYRPDSVIIGGGLAELEEYWFNGFVGEYKKAGGTACVGTTVLKNKAGIMGAAYAAIYGKYKNQ